MTLAPIRPVLDVETPAFNETMASTWTDPDLTDIYALTAAGLDQWAASKIVWADTPPAWDAPPVAWSVWIRRHVAALGRDTRRAIGLPA